VDDQENELPVEPLQATLWPNGLGWDVGEHEVWKSFQPGSGDGPPLRVRLWKNGEPWKHFIAPVDITGPVAAVVLAEKRGTQF